MSFSEWSNKKKKEREEEEKKSSQSLSSSTTNKEEKPSSFADWSNKKHGKTGNGNEDERNSILNSEDFEHYSQIGASVANPTWNESFAPIDLFGWKPFGEGKEIGNIVTFAEENATKASAASGNAMRGGGTTTDHTQLVNLINQYMTDEEKSIYNYYIGKGDTEKAQEYITQLTDVFRMREAGGMIEQADDNALELVYSGIAGLGQFGSGMKNLDNYVNGGDADPTTSLQYANLEMSSNNTGVWRVANDLVNTVGNMAPSILTSMAVTAITGVPQVGEAVGSITMGASATGNAYAEMKNLGYTDSEARNYATLVGSSEALLQYLLGGIGKLGGKLSGNLVTKFVSSLDNAFLKLAVTTSIKMGSEGLEEGIQTAIEPVFKAWVTGEEFEAASLEDVLYSALLGALSAGFLDGVPSAADTVSTTINAKKNYGSQTEALLNEAGQISEYGETVNKYKNKYGEKGELSGSDINYLLEITDTNKIKSATESTLTKYGEKGNTSQLADILTKQVKGEELSRAEQKLLDQSTYGQRVANELNPDNIMSGQYATNWSEQIGTRRVNAREYNKGQNIFSEDFKNKIVTKGVPEESKYKSSESGKTTLKDQEVSIQGIESIKGGEVTVRLENGDVVNASDIEFGSDTVPLMYDMVAKMGVSTNTANELIQHFQPSDAQQASLYYHAIPLAYNYGKIGYNAGLKYITSLSEQDKNYAYRKGVIDAMIEDDAKKNAPHKSKVTNKVREGSMSIEEAQSVAGLTDRQKDSINAVKALSDSLGINIRFFESKVGEDGKRIGANGMYDTETGIVYIDIHAGLNGEGTILYTAAHELTHLIREWSPAKFKVFADFLLAEYGKKNISVDALIRNQIDKAKRNGRDIDFDTAYEEVIADSCESMLADGDAISKIAKLKAKDKSLWQTIKDFITDLVAKIKEAYKGLTPDSVEGRFVGEMLDAATKLKTLWTEALIDAGENYSEVRDALGKGSSIEVNENGEFTVGKTKDGKLLYNDRTYDEGGRETLKETLIAEGFSGEDIKAALTIIDAKHNLVKKLGKEFSEQDKVNKATLTTDLKDGHAVLSALVSNGDYPVNIDLLMVCKKRLAYQRVINRLCETGLIKQATLDSLAIAEINKILGKYGFETACLGCFVESRRIRIQEWAETICKEWNGIVDKMVGKGKAETFNFASETFVKDLSNEEIDTLSNELEETYARDGLHYGKTSVVNKMRQLLVEVPSLRKHLSVADLITPQGRTHLKSLSAELNSLVACRYGSNTPKIVQDFNPYNHELAKYGKVPSKYSSLREYLYAIGGARMQSFSDFIVENWFDYCQIVADLAARKLPMHTYTKEISLVKLFGMTGIKVNMSLIPDIDRTLPREFAGLTKNAKGEYELIWADKDRFKATGGKSYMQSINFADALAIQADPRYSANVGTIAVGISDKHIEMMLDDARIRMVIPYHSSGMNPIFANLVGTDYYNDYTNYQNTTVKHLINSKGEYVDLTLTKDQKGKLTAGFEFNEVLQRLGDARAAAEEYKAWCADASLHTMTINGETYTAVLSPKFEKFADHQNYYKLLEDFNTYDCITEQPAPQGDVQQIYPDEFDKVLKDELESRENYRNKQEPKWETAMGEIESYLKKHTKADTIAYAKEHGIKLSKKDMKLSDRDSQGNELSSEQIEFFKDSKVRDKKGNLLVVYHGTPNQFTVFRQGVADGWGKGSYFTDNKNATTDYGENVVEVYLNIKNPYNADTMSYDEIGAEDTKAYRDFDMEKWKTWWSADYDTYEDYVADGMGVGLNEIYTEEIEVFNKILRELGYDGIIANGSNNIDGLEIVAFYPEQIKLTSNKNPTSSPDIRYSDRDYSEGLSEEDREVADKVIRNLKQQKMASKYGVKKLATYTAGRMNYEIQYSSAQDEPDYAHAYITWVNPLDFVYATTTMESVRERLKEEAGKLDIDRLREQRQAIYLRVDFETGQILGHEGRHRMLALWDAGIDKVAVIIDAKNDKYWHTKPVEIMNLKGQRFEESRTGTGFFLHNLLPLSERYADVAREMFSFDSTDGVRFSDRDTETISNRTLLANALDTVAQNDIEKTKLAQYREKIALIESEQAKLSKIRAEIKELSFAKGPRDTARIKSLQFEANQAANRINTYDRQLLNLESTKALKGVLDREKAMARKKAEQMGKESLRRQKEKDAATVRELLARNYESRKKATESRNKTAMRHKIRKVVNELNQLLLHGSKERNVKLGLQEAVAAALDAINMDTVGADERVAKYNTLIAQAKDPDVIASLKETRDRIKTQGDSLGDKLKAMKEAYYGIQHGEESKNYPAYFKEEATLIEQRIQNVIDKVGNTSLRDMSLTQLDLVYDMYKMVLTTIQNANAVWKEGKALDLKDNASAVMTELEEIKELGEEGTKIGEYIRSYSWNEMTPYYAFDRIGSKTLKSFFMEAIRGQNVYANDVAEAKAFADKIRKKYGYTKWDLDKVYEFKLKDGRTFQVTLKHMLSIYAYSKREQALPHMSTGGFFFNDKSTFRKKGGIIELIRRTDSGYKIDAENLAEIKEALGDKVNYVDEMQEYLTKMGEKGNEVTRTLWGIDLFKEKVYFPLKSMSDFIKKSTETAQSVSLKNDGMTKETVPGASNPIVLEAFDDVWASHIDRMSQYHAFVIPIDNLNKIHQYGTWAGTESMAVSTMLTGRFGSAVNEYISQFIKDLNGNVVNPGAKNPLMGFLTKFKKTAVGASLSTMVQQPTAVLRAMADVNAKYFIGKPNTNKLSNQWEELKQYAPIAIIKDIGGFDAGSGVQVSRWLNTDTLRGVDKVMNTIDDFSMKGAEFFDQLGWTSIWEAVKREISATTNLKVGSEEFLKKAGERFTEVIVRTQVYDSTLSRSGFMRSKSDTMKMLTAFMGEPTLSMNMMFNAIINAKRGGSKKQAVRTIGFTYASIIAASAMASLIYALRDDDDDESYLEKYMQSLGSEFISDVVLAPVTSLPAVKDIASIFQGWDVERTDVAIFKDIKDAFDGLSSETKSPYRKIEDFAGAIAAAFGIPLKNVLRTGREIYNAFSAITDDISGGDAGGAFVEGITGKEQSKPTQLYNAIINGDDARLERIKASYKDESSYLSAVKSALRANDSRIHDAAQARLDGNISEYTRIAREIIAEGHFSQDIVVAAINSEMNTIKKGESTQTESADTKDEATSIYRADDINIAFDNGDTDLALSIIDELVEMKMANGMDEKKAKSSIRSSMTSYWKPLYKQAYASGNTSEMQRIKQILYKSGLYGSASEVIKDVNSWLKN